MGRLTLNVLLSFAQFEREVTGERIRDKIAASKKKGMWMGGNPPLGYDLPQDPSTRALIVNPTEAETVRLIFSRYIELGSVHALERWLVSQGVQSKAWTSRLGRSMGGLSFSRGALFHLLKNRIYLGEIVHKGGAYPGAHPAIVDAATFEEAQRRLAINARRHNERPTRVATMPLRGRIFDADGMPMSPTFTHKAGNKLYRYYVSAPLQQGRRPSSNAISRVPAAAIEALVCSGLERLTSSATKPPTEMPLSALARVELHPTSVQLVVRRVGLFPTTGDLQSELETLSARLAPAWRIMPDASDPDSVRLTIPTRMKLRGGRVCITDERGEALVKPVADQTLAGALKQAHALLARRGGISMDGPDRSAADQAFASSYERKLTQLAFLSPDLQLAILEGRHPVGMTLKTLLEMEIPPAWVDQRRLFGVASIVA